MNERRDFLKTVAGSVAVGLPFVKNDATNAPGIDGVGILRFPSIIYNDLSGPAESAAEVAQKVANAIRKGTIICLPNDRDDHGEYVWDFRIEAGDPKQVKIERQPER